MTDQRFFARVGPYPLGEVAKVIGARLIDATAEVRLIHDVAALESAGPDDLSLFCDLRYLGALRDTRAGAVVTSHDLARHAGNRACLILVDEPRLAYAQIESLFYPIPRVDPVIDPHARIDRTAAIGPSCRVDAGAAIGPKVEIGARCHIGANVVLGAGVMIGDDCRIGANSAISHAIIGARVEIGSCVSIGGPGFGFVRGPRGPMRMPQLGRVVIEDDVKIDMNCAVDRGAHGDTVIGAGTVIDNLVQIAHNVRLGRYCVIAGQSGIAGSTVLGDGVVVGGQVAISDHLTIGSGARIAFKSAVIRDVPAGEAVGGYPAMPVRQWHRQTAGLARLFRRKSRADA